MKTRMSIIYFIVNLDSDKDMNLELYVLQIHILSKAQYMMLLLR